MTRARIAPVSLLATAAFLLVALLGTASCAPTLPSSLLELRGGLSGASSSPLGDELDKLWSRVAASSGPADGAARATALGMARLPSCLLEEFMAAFKEAKEGRAACSVGPVRVNASLHELARLEVDVTVNLEPLSFHTSNGLELCRFLMALRDVMLRAQMRLSDGMESPCLPEAFGDALEKVRRDIAGAAPSPPQQQSPKPQEHEQPPPQQQPQQQADPAPSAEDHLRSQQPAPPSPEAAKPHVPSIMELRFGGNIVQPVSELPTASRSAATARTLAKSLGMAGGYERRASAAAARETPPASVPGASPLPTHDEENHLVAKIPLISTGQSRTPEINPYGLSAMRQPQHGPDPEPSEHVHDLLRQRPGAFQPPGSSAPPQLPHFSLLETGRSGPPPSWRSKTVLLEALGRFDDTVVRVARVLNAFSAAVPRCAGLRDAALDTEVGVPPLFTLSVGTLRDACALFEALPQLVPDEAAFEEEVAESEEKERKDFGADERRLLPHVDRMVAQLLGMPRRMLNATARSECRLRRQSGEPVVVASRALREVKLSGRLLLQLPLGHIDTPYVSMASSGSLDTCHLLQRAQESLPARVGRLGDKPAPEDDSKVVRLMQTLLKGPVDTMADIVARFQNTTEECVRLADELGDAEFGRGAGVSVSLPMPPLRPLVTLVSGDMQTVCATTEAMRQRQAERSEAERRRKGKKR